MSHFDCVLSPIRRVHSDSYLTRQHTVIGHIKQTLLAIEELSVNRQCLYNAQTDGRCLNRLPYWRTRHACAAGQGTTAQDSPWIPSYFFQLL